MDSLFCEVPAEPPLRPRLLPPRAGREARRVSSRFGICEAAIVDGRYTEAKRRKQDAGCVCLKVIITAAIYS